MTDPATTAPRTLARWLAALLLAAASCAAAPGAQGNDTSGIGGTGAPPQHDPTGGIGGTGAPLPHDEGSGIGGTGMPLAANEGSGIGGTGIVGVITGFGSIWVNGVEVHYPVDAVIQTPGGPRGPEVLALGQRVLVAAEQRDGRTAGNRITLLPAVTGPVTASAGDRFTVAGQPVAMASEDAVSRPAVGDWLAVYGLRRADGLIVATAMTPQPAGGPVNVYGVTEANGQGGLRIQGLPLALPATGAPAPGTPVLVTGTLRDGVLVAKRVEPDPVAALAAQHRAVSIQGYVQDAGDARITVGNLAIRVPAATLPNHAAPDVDALVQIEAHHDDDGMLVADRVDALDLGATGLPMPEVDSRGMPSAAGRRDGEDDHGSDGAAPGTVTAAQVANAETGDPELEGPEVEGPEAEGVEVEMPEVESPEVETPEVETPELDTPEVETPELETPEVEVPEVEPVEIEPPETELP